MIKEEVPKRALSSAEPPNFIPRIYQIVSLFRKFHLEIIWRNVIFYMLHPGQKCPSSVSPKASWPGSQPEKFPKVMGTAHTTFTARSSGDLKFL